MNKPCILIIDDEPAIRKLLSISLESQGYRVSLAESGHDGLIIAANHPPDLILLDIGLPDKSGLDILEELKVWYHKAVIMLSVQSDEESIIRALDHGASDYLTKPFRTGELLARVRAAIKRNSPEETSSITEVGEISIDLSMRLVKKNQEIIKLTSTEYQLISLFAANIGKVLTHHFILKEIWGVGYQNESQYLRVYVAQLRKKIEENPNAPKYIITESGVGYRFG
jgi:two-component system, OmpR family, KDP operon response regulator KdpE